MIRSEWRQKDVKWINMEFLNAKWIERSFNGFVVDTNYDNNKIIYILIDPSHLVTLLSIEITLESINGK